ncbi:MAG TPA: hypothetical protein VJ249_05715 [Candidatus Bathyarchaeia archaeon]|nr:hypothetical protein [Candidatus Bathyarchaeia archaeon]
MNVKQFMIGMLLALALLTMAHAPLSGQQGNGRYDPWLDYDENGIIDANELQRLGEAYGSTGDPTKNITIAGHATQYLRPGGVNIMIPPSGSWLSSMISIDGYAKVTVLIWLSTPGNCYFKIYAGDDAGYSWLIETATPNGQSWVKTYDAMSQRIQIEIFNSSPSTVTAQVSVYLVA